MIEVPENKIITISEREEYENSNDLILQSLRGELKREWFVKHAYFCLPLVIGNQMGFVIKSQKTFTVEWNGGDAPINTKVEILDQSEHPGHQHISSHFGMGTVTIQNRFTFRTPKGVNLMTINPPNHFIDGIHHMTGIIETDNLRRDFTFNLKVTRPNHKITINKGDYVGCVIPTPRYFIDGFDLERGENIFTTKQIQEERKAMADFGIERSQADRNKPHGNGRRYFNGEDVYGCPFPDHQKKINKL
jgi:hypothetical protein